MLTSLALTAIAFASTNIDDAFVLVGFFSNRKMRRAAIVVGQFLGIGAVVASALVCSLLTLAVPDRYIGFLGVLPILIGVWHLWNAWSSGGSSADEQRQRAPGVVASVALVTIANCGDNIAVYIPLFSRQSMTGSLAICAVFAVMTAIWCGIAWVLVGHPKLGAPIWRWGGRIMPLVLIGVGVYILISSGAIHL
jgi:cadmium resistance protein CadD (predicted permease)